MKLTGKNWLAGAPSAEGSATFQAKNPANGEKLAPAFHEATTSEIDRAMVEANRAFETLAHGRPPQLASFLDFIGEEITALDDDLIALARAETALPEARLVGERARTIGQIAMFANPGQGNTRRIEGTFRQSPPGLDRVSPLRKEAKQLTGLRQRHPRRTKVVT